MIGRRTRRYTRSSSPGDSPTAVGVRLLRPRRTGQSPDRREGSQAGQGSPPAADLTPVGRLDGATDRGDQPLHRRLHGLLRLADMPWPFEDLDQWLRRRLRQYRGERERHDRDREHHADHGDDRGGEGREDLARRRRGCRRPSTTEEASGRRRTRTCRARACRSTALAMTSIVRTSQRFVRSASRCQSERSATREVIGAEGWSATGGHGFHCADQASRLTCRRRNGPGSLDYSAASASDTACCTVRPVPSHSIGLRRSSVSRRASATPRAVTVCSLRNTSIKARIPRRAARTSA